jgi:hydrogenase 3 maturation protease
MRENNSVETELGAWLSKAGRVCIAGIGNPFRKDDFVGVRIVRILKGRVASNVLLVECNTYPESFIEEILDFGPSHILVIDAALLDRPSGNAVFVTEMKEDLPSISTHLLPLHIFCGYLKGASKAKVALLAIQPKKTDYGEGLTREVADSATALAKILEKMLSAK